MLNERIVAQLGVGILVLDRHGRVLRANRAVVDVLGLDGDPVGSDVGRVLPGRSRLAELAREVTATPAHRQEELVVGRAAGLRRLLVQVTPLEADADGACVALVLLDVTRLRAEDERERRSAALAGLTRLASHIAHELKNPLGALKLYALLLQRQTRENKSGGAELVEKVTRTIDHLSGVVGEVTSFALAGSGPPEPVTPASIAEECLAGVAERLKDASIEVIGPHSGPGGGPGPTAWVDARALKGIVAALIDNAVDAMPGGGTLTVGVAVPGPEEVALIVQDSGAGMSEESQARLFEPFFTTKPGGMGLGMVLARQLVEQQGGRLEVNSRPGAGTTVRLVLPTGTQAEDHGRRAHPGH